MARPPAYTRNYSFSNFETNNPGQPKPGAQLDSEYDAVSNAMTGTQNALALIQRDDGQLANDSVGVDQLQDDVFDGIVDGITDEAQAYATQSASSASASANSASAAASSATAANSSASVASGAASQAGASQAIAQGAADDAAQSAQDAEAAALDAQQAANDTANSVAETEDAVEKAYRWAEYLAAPVDPAPDGYPEAVDDGMWSSKWWALRARDYNSTETIDLGSGQVDIGEAFVEWDETDDLPLGQVYATWGTPPLVYVLTDHDHPELAASWTLISGGPGPPGPANELTIGTVTNTGPGGAAQASITGTPPSQVLNLALPQGNPGPANSLAIGTVTTGAPGSAAAATITGAPPAQVLNLTIPRGDAGDFGTALIDDSNVTGDWVFDPTQFFGFTTAEVAQIKANAAAGILTATDALHAENRLVIDSLGEPTLVLQKMLGSYAALTPTTASQLLGRVAFQGWTAGNVAPTRAAFIDAISAGAWTAASAPSTIRFYATPVGSISQAPVLTMASALIDAYTDFYSRSAARFTGWLGTPSGSNNGPGLELGYTSAKATVLGYDRAGAGAYIPLQLIGSNHEISTQTGLAMRVNANTGIDFGNNVWHGTIGDNAVRLHYSLNSTSYYSSPNGQHYFRVSATEEVASIVGPFGGDRKFMLNATAGATNVFLNLFRVGWADWAIGMLGSASITFRIGGPAGSDRASLDANGNFIAYGNISSNGQRYYIDTRLAISSNSGSDTWLRLNDLANFSSGVFTPGLMNAGGGFGPSANTRLVADGSGRWELFCNTVAPGLKLLDSSGTVCGWFYGTVGGGNSVGILDGAGSWQLQIGPTNCTITRGVVAPSYTVSSSRTLKRETGKPKGVHYILERLRPVLYRMLKGDDREQVGLIAEEVHEVCPFLSDGKTVAYDRLALLLLAAWQEDRGFA